MNTGTGKRHLLKRFFSVAALVLLLLTSYYLGGGYIRYKRLNDKLPELDGVYSDLVYQNRNFTDKVWIHRMDSKERFKELANKYKGIELDLMYDSASNNFDVRHPPVESCGFSLEDAFAATPNIKEHYFWLDYKNLSEAVKLRSCSKLLSLTKKYNILKNVIVESPDPEALTLFTGSGFYTSYYLPDIDIERNSVSDIEKYYNVVKEHLQASKVCALSGNYQQLPFVEKYFPDKDVLLWYLNESRGLKYEAGLYVLTRKEKVKVVLVEEMTPGYR